METYAWGPPPVSGCIRSRPEDFRVVEDLGFEPGGQGEHLWVRVEKTGLNTQEVAGALGEAAGLGGRSVSFAGLKDRNAVTRQWFSIHLGLDRELDPAVLEGPGLRVLEAARSARKIRRGKLAGNRFELVVRDIRGDRGELEQRLGQVAAAGVPNAFGEQRFGGNNIARAYRLFRGELRRKPTRSKRGFYLSAARSLIFNRVLEARLGEGTWNRLIDGDWAMLEGSRSGFAADPDDPDQQRRCAEMDLHPSGPMAGEAPAPVSGRAAELENRVLDEHDELRQGLARFRLETMRRPLRMAVHELSWRWEHEGVLHLDFRLGQGGFATTVLRELVNYTEGS